MRRARVGMGGHGWWPGRPGLPYWARSTGAGGVAGVDDRRPGFGATTIKDGAETLLPLAAAPVKSSPQRATSSLRC